MLFDREVVEQHRLVAIQLEMDGPLLGRSSPAIWIYHLWVVAHVIKAGFVRCKNYLGKNLLSDSCQNLVGRGLLLDFFNQILHQEVNIL
jgi:hypothetical protein